MTRWIVSQLEIAPGDHVVEIGPGLGALTDVLVEHDISLTIIEKDDRLIDHLRRRFDCPKVTLHHEDATTFDTRKLLGKGPLRIIGNLPYYVSTPLIDRFADPLLAPERIIFTLQKELADRLNAVPRTKAYGAMTVCVGRRWKVRTLKILPASVFYPQPKVDSAVVLFEPRPRAEVPVCNEVFYERLVREGFAERRKQLHRSLGPNRERWSEASRHLGVLETARAEELSISQWTELARFFEPGEAQSGDEWFDVVDENDQVVEALPRDEVHARDLRHRAVHILIVNSHGELLLQRRSIWKDRNPGLWDSSTAGHVDSGESYEEAARREIVEELGIEIGELKPLFRIGCGPETGWEFLQIYAASSDLPVQPRKAELEGVMPFSLEQIDAWLERRPEDFTPIFQQVYPRWRRLPS